MKKYDVVIVGGGLAGMYCSAVLGDLNSILIEPSDKLGGQAAHLYPEKMVYDVPCIPAISGGDLVAGVLAQMNAAGAKYLLNTTFDGYSNHFLHSTESGLPKHKLDTGSGFVQYSASKSSEWADLVGAAPSQILDGYSNHFIVNLKDAEPLHTKNLLFSTGVGLSKPRRPDLENIEELEKEGFVRYSVPKFSEWAGKSIVIVGGGDSAADYAVHLSQVGAKVQIVYRGNELRCMQYLKDQLTGVKVHYGAVITEASIHNNKLVVCTNHEKLECDMLLPCLGMAIDGKAPKIEVNPATCEAISTPNLYAIGSAASYQYKKDLIVSGFGDAAKAANAIRRKHV